MKILEKEIINSVSKISYYNILNLNYNIKSQIKKILEIIYQYHIRGKKITFVNVPNFFIKIFKKSVKKSKHSFVPTNIWINGLITNRSACFYSKLKKKKKTSVNFFLEFKKKSDLIVDFGAEKKETENLIKESCIALIPTITLNKNLLKYIFTPTYFITNDLIFNKKFFFYSILQSILKKKIEVQKNFYKFEKDFYTKKKIYFSKKNKQKYKNKKKIFYKKN